MKSTAGMDQKYTVYDLYQFVSKVTERSWEERLTDIRILSSWHSKCSAQVSVRLQSERKLRQKQQIKYIQCTAAIAESIFTGIY